MRVHISRRHSASTCFPSLSSSHSSNKIVLYVKPSSFVYDQIINPGLGRVYSSTTLSQDTDVETREKSTTRLRAWSPLPPRARRKLPRHTPSDIDRFRALIEEIGLKLGVSPPNLDAWYQIRNEDVVTNGGQGLLRTFNSSLSRVLKTVYPEHPWDDSRFHRKPHFFWVQSSNQKKFVEELGAKLGIASGDMDAWYKVTHSNFVEHGGAVLLKQYNNQIWRLLSSVFPEHTWDRTRFKRKNRRFWSQESNHKGVVLAVGSKLGISESNLDAWYTVKNTDIIKNGGGSLLSSYQGSLYRVLKAVFPEHNWDPLQFSHKPQGFWQNPEVQRAYLTQIGLKKGIKVGEMEPWYRVTARDIIALGGKSLLTYHNNSPAALIKSTFPEHNWVDHLFTARKRPAPPFPLDHSKDSPSTHQAVVNPSS